MIRIAHDFDYDASIDDTFAVIVDPATYDEVAVCSKALEYDVSVTDVHQVHTITLDRHLPTDEVPSFAKSLVGESLHIRESTWWKSGTPDDGHAPGYHATYDVRIVGTPVSLVGTMQLIDNGDQTKQIVEGELKAAVPFLGGKIESSVQEPIDHQITTVARIVRERLAR